MIQGLQATFQKQIASVDVAIAMVMLTWNLALQGMMSKHAL